MKVYEKIMEIQSKDSKLFLTPFTMQVSFIRQHYKHTIDYDVKTFFPKINYNTREGLLLRIVHIFALLRVYSGHISYQVGYQGLSNDRKLKFNHEYSLTLKIGHETVDIIKKKGYGLFSNINDIKNTLIFSSSAFEEYVFKESSINLTENEKNMLKPIFRKIYAKSVDEYLIEFVNKLLEVDQNQ